MIQLLASYLSFLAITYSAFKTICTNTIRVMGRNGDMSNDYVSHEIWNSARENNFAVMGQETF